MLESLCVLPTLLMTTGHIGGLTPFYRKPPLARTCMSPVTHAVTGDAKTEIPPQRDFRFGVTGDKIHGCALTVSQMVQLLSQAPGR